MINTSLESFPKKNSFATRIAPSPTGHLHIGHVLHLMWVKAVSHLFSAKIRIRLEDHDQSRCRPEYVDSIEGDLRWLGFGDTYFSSQSSRSFFCSKQTDRLGRYDEIAKVLTSQGLIYACRCSRRQIAERQSEPGDDTPQAGELHYAGTCRDLNIPLDSTDTCLRVRLPDKSFIGSDLLLGSLEQNPYATYGDTVIRDRNRNWTYQFAVVVDDMDQNINLIIRGQDLKSSVARQLALREILNAKSDIIFLHHPLIMNSEGDKLSKFRKSPAISELRQLGLTPNAVFKEAFALTTHQTVPELSEYFEELVPLEVAARIRRLVQP
jgi:glutamyl-Q tRNA(Asp) synthetase